MSFDPRKSVMVVSLLTSIVMLAGKMTAYLLTHSVALLSDAAESVVHGFATALATFSLWYAARPADTRHPYGYARIAYFSVGFEGALVLAAACAVIYSGAVGLVYGTQLQRLGIGLSIAGGLAVINLILGSFLVVIGRRHNALILVANGKHVLSDMWTTAAAILGVGLVMLTGIDWLDPAVAICIGAYIMICGGSLLRQAFAGLMDRADPELSQVIKGGLNSAARDHLIADFHQLRCRKVNDAIWVDLHLLVPGHLSTLEAHERVTKVEDSIRRLFPKDTTHITSHIEPADHSTAHPGGHDDMIESSGD